LAATRLGVSKAAMSQHIADLERVAGVALVQRTTRSVRLTEAGQRLVDDTGPSFEQIARSFAQVRDMAGVPSGLLRVTAPVAFTRQQLMPRLPEFLREYPEVRIELHLSDRISSLAIEGFDLAIRHTANPPDTHVAWSLCSTHSVLVASRSYLRRFGTPATPEDLLAHNCLHYPRAQDTPAWTFEPVGHQDLNAQAAERVTIPVSGTLSANNSEALRDAALAGLGITLLPDFRAQASLKAGKLVQVLPQWKPVGSFAEKLYAIRPYSAQVPRAVTAFVSYLRRSLADGFGEVAQVPTERVG
jgi:DNA-binding transcriptional LysR family regulator